ncbi:MAG: hypothetical protein LBB67_04650 [Oscillospiraceae bacterium]|jgi:shikimate dehydrogenase|nr:hypothetical protein [Oscillospiraceae bacterium]
MQFGLIGEHLGHSYSAEIHKLLRGYDYRLQELTPWELPSFFQKRDFIGINVTIPYKRDAMRYCEAISPAARSIGCVNTVVKRGDGTLFGDNTDLAGFRFMLKHAQITPEGKHVLILGKGGASLMAQTACKTDGAASVAVASRGEDINLRNAHERCPHTQVIINATPVGMFPHTDVAPLTLARFLELEAVADMIYNPLRTHLLQEARGRGLLRTNGMPMLVAQAKAASDLFTGEPLTDAAVTRVLDVMQKKSNWILIGMPGCGKSTIGAYLAAKSGRKWVDMDDQLLLRHGLTAGDFILAYGEEAFRDAESACIADICRQTELIISTGGGAVMREKNVAALRQNGNLLWIQRDLRYLARENRPLSANNDALVRMLRKREPFYAAAADGIVVHHEDWKRLQAEALDYFCKGGNA